MFIFRIPYMCARISRWGDILPMKLNEKEVTIVDDIDDKNIIEDTNDNNSDNEDSHNETKR